jgi:hypothetical protein
MDAHWVNDRAGYRCRHGHNSARRATPDRLRNLYVREDLLIAELVQHALIDADDPAEYLRSRDMVVVHDRAGWSLAACDGLSASDTSREATRESRGNTALRS